jgi:hypothetical protein
VDTAGDAYVVGSTWDATFPATASVFQPKFVGGNVPVPGGSDGFVAKLNSTGHGLARASFLGGTDLDQANTIALDPAGDVWVTGIARLGLASAAGGSLAGRIAPVEVISIYGLDLGPAAPVTATFDADGFWPTTLGGIHVTIDGTPAPLLYVSATQINAVVPLKLSSSSPAGSLDVTTNSESLRDVRVIVDMDNPKVFLRADGTVAGVNLDGSLNTATNPAKRALTFRSGPPVWVEFLAWPMGRWPPPPATPLAA